MRHRSSHRRIPSGIVTLILAGALLASAAIKVAPAAAQSVAASNPLSQILAQQTTILNAIGSLPLPPPPTDLSGATPNWDKALPAATRFVVLAAFGNEAVLDKNTGLVWEQAPDATLRSWSLSTSYCANRTVGGTVGWRLPSVIELNRDFPLERGYGEYTGVNLAGRSKAFAASHTPCIHARCCIANARFRMGFRPSVVM